MPNVNGLDSLATLETYPSCTPGYCLHYVWTAYKENGARSDGSYPTAYSAWCASGMQHPDDWNPPAGFPVYLGPRAGSSAGDVFISMGDGWGYGTDWPYNGVLGAFTIEQRLNQTGRPYLGWCGDMLGNPIITEEIDMDANQAWQLQALYNSLLVFNDGAPQYSFAQAALNAIRTEVEPVLNAIPTTPQVVDIDYDKLAQALVAQGMTVAIVEPNGQQATPPPAAAAPATRRDARAD